MAGREDPDDRERLYRDVWGSVPADHEPPRSNARPDRPGAGAENLTQADPYARRDWEWEAGERLRALEVDVRDLRAAVKSLQRSTEGSIGELLSSIRKLSDVLGAEPEAETRAQGLAAPDPAPPTPTNPIKAAEAQQGRRRG